MNDKKCERCAWRARYDQDASSLLGRIWRWHANWCPGWKKYMNSLSPEERTQLAVRYGMSDRFKV